MRRREFDLALIVRGGGAAGASEPGRGRPVGRMCAPAPESGGLCDVIAPPLRPATADQPRGGARYYVES